MNNPRGIPSGPQRGGPGGRPGGPMAGRLNAEKPKNTGKILGRLLKYIGSSRGILIAIIIIMAAVTALDLAVPWVQGEAINQIRYDKATGLFSVNFNGDAEGAGLYFYLAVLAVLYLLSSVLSFFSNRMASKLSMKTVYKLRRDLFKQISTLPIKYTDTHRHGDIMSRMTNDVENVSNTISQSIASLFSSVITLVGTVVLMLSISPAMTAIAFVAVPLTLIVSSCLAKAMRKYYVRQQKLLGELNGHIEEMVTGYHTVVAYGKEGEECEKFEDISSRLRTAGIRAKVWGGIMGPCMNIIGNLQYLLIACIGGVFAINGSIGVGDIQKLLGYSKKFTRPINELANQYTSILTALAGAERIFDIMDGESEIDEGNKSIDPDAFKGNIEFKNIDFSYVENQRVLKNFNLSVKSGQKVAIVGATGSGKTTVVNLLTRFYEVDGGSISIDGVDIREIPKAELRKSIGIVLQDTVLFSDTIRANIMYGNFEATEEDMKRAAEMANAAEFIERLPEGYDTQLTEAGRNLSQGQRQLLSIAGAILKDPKILILDEATSSVDTRTEMNIQSAMVALMKNRTSLIIAHRLSTIRDSDVIVVISDGHVVEAGNHDDLLAKRGEYYKLYSSQFAGVNT